MAEPDDRNDVDSALAIARKLYPDQSVSAAPTSISEDVGRMAGQAVAGAPAWLRAGSDPNRIESAVQTAMNVLPPFAVEQGVTDAKRGNYESGALNIASAIPGAKIAGAVGHYATPVITKAMAAIAPKAKFAIEDATRLFKFMKESKIVDREGNPLRMYHITNKDLNVLKPGGDDPELSGLATWMSPYAHYQPAAHNTMRRGEFVEGANVMPLYANIKNPLVIDSDEALDAIRKKYPNNKNFPHYITKEAREAMVREGYDGAIFGGYGAKPYSQHNLILGEQPGGKEEVISFFPEQQLKSAIGNRGTYYSNIPDITKASGGYIHKDGGGAVDDFRANPNQQEIDAAMAIAQQQAQQARTAPPSSVTDLLPVNARPPEDRNAKVSYTVPGVGEFTDTQQNIDRRARMREYATNESWPAQALKAAAQAFTFPGRAATGQVPEDQMIPEAVNLAMTFTGGAAGVPMAAEGTELRAGAGLYSKAERAAQAIPMDKMQGQQALAMLQKAGVSPEELKWSGVDEALKRTPQLTKDDLLRMIREGDVQLDEKILGAKHNYPYTTFNEWNDAYMGAEQRGDFDEAQNIMTAWEADEGVGTAGNTKYKKYSLPGGQNYQETLITLPAKDIYTPFVQKMKADFIEGAIKGGLENGLALDRATEIANKIADASKPHDFANYLGRQEEFNKIFHTQKKLENIFESSHWDQPNVLAHLRTNEFPAVNEAGEQYRAFNLDELQSDWAQEGRTGEFGQIFTELPDGFTVEKVPYRSFGNPEITERYEVRDEDGDLRGFAFDRETAINSVINDYNSGVVPAAPYVQSTNQWTDLGLKKALSQAIDRDADVFTWTPGDVNAKRYDLSKQIDSLQYFPEWKTNRGRTVPARLVAYKDGYAIVEKDLTPKDKLENFVGKEIAKKISDTEPKLLPGNRRPSTYLENQDLEIGGEGMKDFYNNIVPKRLSEVIRKATGQKPEFQKFQLQTADGPQKVYGVKLTPEMKAKLKATKEESGGYFPHFAKGGAVKKAMQVSSGNDTDAVLGALNIAKGLR